MQRFRQGGPVVGKVSDGTLKITAGVIPDYPHNFVSVIACDEHGSLPINPNNSIDLTGITGNFKIEVETVNNPVPQNVPDGISASAPAEASWAGNTVAIYVTPESVVGTTHFRVMWSHNIS